MLATDINDVKIYNLSGGKSLPEWLESKRKKTKKQAADGRIELIHDFTMPGVANCIDISPDGQYIIATGTYKPRVKCFEVSNLSIKFERCFDSEVERLQILSDDYTKLAFLHADRYLEIHAGYGRHYRLRIPSCGRDLRYHKPTCDLLVVGSSQDIYRFNLERGQFLLPYTTSATAINSCAINPEHNLICVGTQDGTVEAWDHRVKKSCGTLDVASNLEATGKITAVSTIAFKNGLTIGAGTSSGHVLLYDIRARTPLLVKDHLNQLPIKKILFQPEQKSVYSLDAAMLKIWDENTKKQKAFIESTSLFNDFANFPRSGLFIFAQEDTNMLPYYVPTEGPAPRWCSFLDNLTEEIDSETVQNVYDDYKFITKLELAELKLEHLEGTKMLRAYMHGFFMDIRLYNKAKAAANPFGFDGYRKEKIRKQIEAARPARIQLKSDLPDVNRELARQLEEEQHLSNAKRKMAAKTLLSDDRFKTMFQNPDFEIDKNADDYRILSSVLKRAERDKARRKGPSPPVEEKEEDEQSTDDDFYSEKSDSDNDSSDEQEQKEVDGNAVAKKGTRKHYEAHLDARPNVDNSSAVGKMDVQQGTSYSIVNTVKKVQRVSFGKRLSKIDHVTPNQFESLGKREISFTIDVKKDKQEQAHKKELELHKEERRKVIRSAKGVIRRVTKL